jgi:hypothetical protein
MNEQRKKRGCIAEQKIDSISINVYRSARKTVVIDAKVFFF